MERQLAFMQVAVAGSQRMERSEQEVRQWLGAYSDAPTGYSQLTGCIVGNVSAARRELGIPPPLEGTLLIERELLLVPSSPSRSRFFGDWRPGTRSQTEVKASERSRRCRPRGRLGGCRAA